MIAFEFFFQKINICILAFLVVVIAAVFAFAVDIQ